MLLTEAETELIKQGLDDAINRISTPSWVRKAKAARESWKAGTATPQELAEAMRPVPASRRWLDTRPVGYHDELKTWIDKHLA